MTFIDSIGQATSCDQLTAMMANSFRSFGIEHFCLIDAPSTTLDAPISFFLGRFPSGWLDLYEERHFEDVDPILRRALITTEAFEWRDAFHPGRDRAAREMMGLQTEHGLKYGLSFSVRRSGGRVGGGSLASADPAFDPRVNPALHLMALYSFWRAEVLRDPARMAVPALSSREIEVLTWSAAGKTSGEIAAILRITERTALAHAINAANKLGASNRTHAVARALALGLIAP